MFNLVNEVSKHGYAMVLSVLGVLLPLRDFKREIERITIIINY